MKETSAALIGASGTVSGQEQATADHLTPVALLDGVTKVFGTATAVDDLSLCIEPGQIYGMIGPSGCGKTTIVRLLVGVLAPDGGTIRLLGVEPSSSAITCPTARSA